MGNRLVTGTKNDEGRVTFNELSIRGQLPDRLILLAIDRERDGIVLWMTRYGRVADLAKEQVAGYSVAISSMSVASPPAELGKGWFIPADRFSPALWDKLCNAKTRGLKKAGEEVVRELFAV